MAEGALVKQREACVAVGLPEVLVDFQEYTFTKAFHDDWHQSPLTPDAARAFSPGNWTWGGGFMPHPARVPARVHDIQRHDSKLGEGFAFFVVVEEDIWVRRLHGLHGLSKVAPPRPWHTVALSDGLELV